MRQAQLELRQKIIGRQVSFELVPLGSFAIENLYGWRPLCAKALKSLRLFLDVDLYRNEILVDEVFYAGIRINFGVQPSTGASHRRGIKVQQRGFCFGSGFI
jgi:hypothetical protein